MSGRAAKSTSVIMMINKIAFSRKQSFLNKIKFKTVSCNKYANNRCRLQTNNCSPKQKCGLGPNPYHKRCAVPLKRFFSSFKMWAWAEAVSQVEAFFLLEKSFTDEQSNNANQIQNMLSNRCKTGNGLQTGKIAETGSAVPW